MGLLGRGACLDLEIKGEVNHLCYIRVVAVWPILVVLKVLLLGTYMLKHDWRHFVGKFFFADLTLMLYKFFFLNLKLSGSFHIGLLDPCHIANSTFQRS
ncbi:hypothetical protein IEQ34_004630 [Dendrobium chrysotoxum]|uniref:Transmembrane protein n=1 Tax=Dendrobium chrysotoxum TaxID=161865 RepID=A0AAV7HGH6_DENCH|nr:hypothetical protein IEQ34_004630 [Dendrobium chrysotoxum]